MFTPSLDWGAEWLVSLLWIAKAWAIAAVATLAILALIFRFTTWGRQFWRITGAYFTGRASVKIYVWLAAMLFLVIISVRLNVLMSYYSNDMLTSFQVIATGIGGNDEAVKNSGKAGFWLAMLVFSVLVTIYVARVMLDLFVAQRQYQRAATLQRELLDRQIQRLGRNHPETQASHAELAGILLQD